MVFMHIFNFKKWQNIIVHSESILSQYYTMIAKRLARIKQSFENVQFHITVTFFIALQNQKTKKKASVVCGCGQKKKTCHVVCVYWSGCFSSNSPVPPLTSFPTTRLADGEASLSCDPEKEGKHEQKLSTQKWEEFVAHVIVITQLWLCRSVNVLFFDQHTSKIVYRNGPVAWF